MPSLDVLTARWGLALCPWSERDLLRLPLSSALLSNCTGPATLSHALIPGLKLAPAGTYLHISIHPT